MSSSSTGRYWRGTLPPPPLERSSAPPERIRPERMPHPRIQWEASSHRAHVGSMTISDISPRLALKRILLLYENGQYREAANFINRLGHPTFRTVLGQLPVDLFVEAMPHSVSILEALYAKVFLSSDCSVKWLKPGGLVLKLVRLLCAGPPDGWTLGAKKLLKVIVLTEPALKKGLRARRRALDKAVEGLGKHGLVGTSDESLCSLHEALKVQFRNLVEAYRGALHKLEELSLVKGQGGGAPVQASHQRQLSLRQGDVQERLIKNKSLLNAVEAATADRSLAVLLAILERRVEADKEALFQFTQVKKEIMPGTEPEDTVVAPLLMRYSHACHQVLQMMKEVGYDSEEEEECDSSDISGYHSDSDSAVMMSGNSPYITKRARHNFLTRSVRSGSQRSGASWLLMTSESPTAPPTVSSTDWEWRGVTGSQEVKTNRRRSNSRDSSSNDSSLKSCHHSLLKHVGSPQQSAKLNGKSGSNNSTTSKSNTNSKTAIRPSSCNNCHLRATLQIRPPGGGGIGTLVIPPSNPPPPPPPAQSSLPTSQQRQPQWGQMAEVASLQSELEATKMELEQTKARLDAFNAQAQAMELGSARLVRCYGNLYSQGRAEALRALDALPQLDSSSELKSKILFSIVVLAFRSTNAQLLAKKEQVKRILVTPSQGGGGTNAQVQLESAISMFLRRTVDTYDLSHCIEEVMTQLWATLYDYPCLKTCQGLLQYIKDSVRLTWALCNQCPGCVLEYEERSFRSDLHVRAQTADVNSNRITTYLWPALVNSADNSCLHKSVVIT